MNEGIINIAWSDEDEEWVATHSDFPSLSVLNADASAAIRGLTEILNGE